MTTEQIWESVRNGGPPVILLLLLAIGWLLLDRNRLLKSISAKDVIIMQKSDKLESLSERLLVVLTEVRTFLFRGQQ